MHPKTDLASAEAPGREGGALRPAPSGALLALLLAVLVQGGLLAFLLLTAPGAWAPFQR